MNGPREHGSDGGDGAADAPVAVVTGATSGIGEETALGLARAGYRLVLVARSRTRADATRERLAREAPGAAVEVAYADFGKLAEVRAAGAEIRGRHPRIARLVNNAGLVNLRREVTPDGLEATFAVNHLAPFLLTAELLPSLRAAAPARIVNVSSEAHRFGAVDLEDLQSERGYRGMRVYGRSKSANLLFTLELARRLEGSGVVVHAIHPGAVSTRLGHQHGWWAPLVTGLLKPFFKSPAQGAETSLHAALDPGAADGSGRYWKDSRPASVAAHARDAAAARRLWDASAALCGLPPDADAA